MAKTILITGSTDGIGYETAKLAAAQGHFVLLHGRNPTKLAASAKEIGGHTESYVADLSKMVDVEALASAIAAKHNHLDVLINNAGILKTSDPRTAEGLDVRFVVNTIAPYLLTKSLMPLFDKDSRIVNVSSAAQAPVNLAALAGEGRLSDMEAYSQSKLAIAMWSRSMANSLGSGPAVITLNPGSLLASKMVKEGFGIAGSDLSIGAKILLKAALDEAFANASGDYFDNDSGKFAQPHPDALDAKKCDDVVHAIESVLKMQ